MDVAKLMQKLANDMSLVLECSFFLYCVPWSENNENGLETVFTSESMVHTESEK